MNLAGWLHGQLVGHHLHLKGWRHGGAIQWRRKSHARSIQRRRISLHVHRDFIAILVASQRYVGAVGKLQPQHVLTRRQLQRGGDLAFAKVQMLVIGDDHIARRHKVGVD